MAERQQQQWQSRENQGFRQDGSGRQDSHWPRLGNDLYDAVNVDPAEYERLAWQARSLHWQPPALPTNLRRPENNYTEFHWQQQPFVYPHEIYQEAIQQPFVYPHEVYQETIQQPLVYPHEVYQDVIQQQGRSRNESSDVSGPGPSGARLNVQTTRERMTSAHQVSDPQLFRDGVESQERLVPAATSTEQALSQSKPLDAAFKNRKDKFFSPGRVFVVLWAEPAGSTTGTELTQASDLSINPAESKLSLRPAKHQGESVYSKIRRFVVVRTGYRSCSALAISTYNGQGAGKTHLALNEHGIVYTGKTIPKPTQKEFGMTLQAVRVAPSEQTTKLSAMSRINYGKVYTVEFNVKAADIGLVHPRSIHVLHEQFKSIWERGFKAGTALMSTPKPILPLSEKDMGLIATKWAGEIDLSKCEDDIAKIATVLDKLRVNGLLKGSVRDLLHDSSTRTEESAEGTRI